MNAPVRVLISALALFFASSAQAIYGAQEAINDALNDDLTYVGRFIPHGSESGVRPVCVYRGTKVVVYSAYCVKDKVGAVGMRIHSVRKSKGSVQFYAEAQDKNDIDQVKRDRYSNYGFYVAGFANDSFDFNGSIAKMKAFDTKIALNPNAECLGSPTHPARCRTANSNSDGRWSRGTAEFIKRPTTNWYRLIHLLRTKVPTP